MKLVFLWGATVLYIAQCVTLLYTKDNPGAVVISGYVLANLGLIWSFS